MPLTKFNIGQKVTVLGTCLLEDDIYVGHNGVVVDDFAYYTVEFDNGLRAGLFNDDELCEWIPTNIMEYLKYMILERVDGHL